MQDATFTSTTSNVINESVHPVTAGTTFATNYRNAVCGAITTVYNGTGAGGILITAGNYTQTGCSLKNNTGTFTATTNWLVNYPVTFDANNSATDVIFDTTVGISGVTDWYSIFIVIGAMVVLILLTVIIITAIRGSGMMGGTTNATGSQNVGSA